MPVGILNIFLFYQEDEEEEGINEMDQPLQDLPPSPLNDPHEEFQDQPEEVKLGFTRQTLKERLQERIVHEVNANLKANIQWELHVVELAEQRFPQIDQIYEAHHQAKLPLNMMKIEQDQNMAIHMPFCQMEDLGKYKPLVEDEINGNTPLLNQPKWRLAYFKLHNQSIL